MKNRWQLLTTWPARELPALSALPADAPFWHPLFATSEYSVYATIDFFGGRESGKEKEEEEKEEKVGGEFGGGGIWVADKQLLKNALGA